MVDWAAHKKHRDYMVGTTGQWAGLLNENGEPVCDLPPVVEIEGDTARSDLSELTLTVQARTPSGETHRLLMRSSPVGWGRWIRRRGWFHRISRRALCALSVRAFAVCTG